ncbi:MAG: hypothetical protein K6G33_05620 [Ruminococcus sp.]|uniref:hypothetical protein n=1 Tax=Ruminococcus sp. TaxID=41978 RepID=UPI0025D67671|nr:hypothetical protein [Ruminococcus sp.]MCR5600204.1 hypothetical protein [Ruminococcus sp.]
MKDYMQVSDSVFKKAEQRIAEKKRRSAIVRRNAFAAAGAAAVLFVVLLQNDDIRAALRALPKVASNAWSDNTPATTQITTQPPVTTTETTTTTTTTAKHTTTEKTTTSTETTTTTAVTTTSPTENMIKLYLINDGIRVTSADYESITLSNGYRVSFVYGAPDLRGLFKEDDIVSYKCSFAYDKNANIYYYLNGCFEAEQKVIKPSPGYDENGDYIEPVTDEYRGAPDPPPENKDDYDKDKELAKLKYDDSIPALDYKDIQENPDLLLAAFGTDPFEPVHIKIKVTGLKIVESDWYEKVSEDGRKWYLCTSMADGMTYDDLLAIDKGDIIDMIGFFSYDPDKDVIIASDICIKKVN